MLVDKLETAHKKKTRVGAVPDEGNTNVKNPISTPFVLTHAATILHSLFHLFPISTMAQTYSSLRSLPQTPRPHVIPRHVNPAARQTKRALS